MKTALKLVGVGLRKGHFSEWLQSPPPVAWIEVHTDNYLDEAESDDLLCLQQLASRFPVSLHGVGLSLGSTDELNWSYLFKLKRLMTRLKPCFVSDHLAWSSLDGRYYHDLFPIPFNEETLAHVAKRINDVQQFLGTTLLIENIANYVGFNASTLTEQDFLTALCAQTKCGLLLDINNVYVSAHHLHFSSEDYLAAIPPDLIQAIHLSGHSTTKLNNEPVLIDSHDQPINEAVWSLYASTIERIGIKPTLIEWDQELPSLARLYDEAYRAEMIMREIYAARKAC
jgi:uncharacterized protein